MVETGRTATERRDRCVDAVRLACYIRAAAGGPDSHVPQDKIAEAASRVPDEKLVVIPVGQQVHATRPAEFAAVALDFLLA